MRLFVALLILAFSLPAAAQEKKAEKKTEKKATKKTEKKEKTQAKAEPKQEWGRFSANAPKDMKKLEEKKAK